MSRVWRIAGWLVMLGVPLGMLVVLVVQHIEIEPQQRQNPLLEEIRPRDDELDGLIYLPHARHAHIVDVWPTHARLVFNLLADGTLILKTQPYPMLGDEDVDPDLAWEALASQVAEIRKGPERDRSLGVVLHFDHRVPLETCLRVLELFAAGSKEAFTVEFLLRSTDPTLEAHIPAIWRPDNEAGAVPDWIRAVLTWDLEAISDVVIPGVDQPEGQTWGDFVAALDKHLASGPAALASDRWDARLVLFPSDRMPRHVAAVIPPPVLSWRSIALIVAGVLLGALVLFRGSRSR